MIVTGGGGSGCGRAIATAFAERGATLVVSDINEAGGQAAFFCADVGNEPQVRKLVEFAESRFGSLSVLVNNASSPHPASEGLAGWTGALQTDLLGTICATRWAIEAMRRTGGGSIVNMSSISALWHGRRTPGGFPGYDVAKLGVIRLTTGLAKEVENDHICVNWLAPGWIASDGPIQYWESLTPAQRKERAVRQSY